jgi:phosphohistidine phosphatase SixA
MNPQIINYRSILSMVVFLLMLGCGQDDPVPVPANTIISENFVEGVLFQQFQEGEFEIHIQTSSPATFSRASGVRSFDIDPSGRGMVDLRPNLYFVNIRWADNTEERLPIIITNHIPEAKNTIKALKNMSTDHEGYVFIFRHADAREGEDIMDPNIPEWWKSCDPNLARQMNDRGRENSARIGLGIRNFNAPLGKGISSEFCRARQTLELMDLNIPVTIDARLNHENASSDQPIAPDINVIISEYHEPGKILIIVGHFNMMERSPYLPYIEPFSMSDGLLMKRNSDGTQKFIGCIPFSYWALFV